VTKQDVRAISDRFKDLPTLQHFRSLESKILPIVDKVKESQDAFSYEHGQMQEMIRRFDELLANKVNKISLIELEHRIGENFLARNFWDTLQEKFSKITSDINEQLIESQNFIGRQQQSINALVVKTVQEKLEFML